ncbi:MAG: hypothetical protein Q8O22_05495 [Candidatus Omnitrophota bacterium]|nr:hypothetical protein [Candidatus Omnitrophota bacterium]
MLRRLGKRAQTTAEYAILIALVVGAVVAMQIYVKRGIQGRVRDVVDHVGAGGDVAGQNVAFTAEQYEPYYAASTANTEQNTSTDEEMQTGGGTVRGSTSNVAVNRTVNVSNPDEAVGEGI